MDYTSITSVPLHLLYNSVVFQTSAVNMFTVALVSESFIGNTGAEMNNIRIPWPYDVDEDEARGKLIGYARDSPSWRNMTNAECIKQYARGYISEYSNLLLVSKTYNQSELFYQMNIHNPTMVRPTQWMCNWGNDAEDMFVANTCNADQPVNPGNWTLKEFTGDAQDRVQHNMRAQGMTEDEITLLTVSMVDNAPRREYKVSYCMDQPVTEMCRLQYSQTILAIVTLINALKAACMLYIAFFGTDRDPLVTIGDAIASFMEREDVRTSGFCATPLAVVNDPNAWEAGVHTQARRLGSYPRRWINTPSISKWIVTVFFFVIVILSSGLLIIPGVTGREAKKTASEIWNAGLGKTDVNSLINLRFFNTQLKNVILSNTPQLVLSVLYLLYNSLFTVMLTNLEWTTFSIKRSYLRVSFPRKNQLSSLRLQIPYRYGIPLLILSLLLHWLVSQSIFVAQIEVLAGIDTYVPTEESPFFASKVAKTLFSTGLTSPDGRRMFAVIKTCGYSVVGIISSLVVGLLALVGVLCLGWFNRYPGGMQLGATYSAVISAACHSYRPIDRFDGKYKKLKWGEAEEVGRMSATGAGHLTFSSGEVKEPTAEGFYGVQMEVAISAMMRELRGSGLR